MSAAANVDFDVFQPKITASNNGGLVARQIGFDTFSDIDRFLFTDYVVVWSSLVQTCWISPSRLRGVIATRLNEECV